MIHRMKSSRCLKVAFIGLLFLFVLAKTIHATTPASNFPTQVFSPYVDASNWPPPDFTNLYAQTGVKYFTMAFIIAASDGSGAVTWGGFPTYTNGYLLQQVNDLRAIGGDVIISLGGEAGTPLAEVHTNATELQAAYQSIVDMYDLQWMDFDIEGAHIHASNEAIDRRNKAIAALQVANPTLKISFTVPSQPDVGLNSDGTSLLNNAKTNNVRIDTVNPMTMYFGMYPSWSMAEKTIAVATNLAVILKNMYPAKSDAEINAMIGLTPNIGFNTTSEIFSLSDATQVLAFAQSSKINMLAFWSTRRDNGSCPGSTGYNADCSGIAQTDFEFSKLFLHFTTNSPQGGSFTLSVSAGTHGTISPSGAVVVASGSNQVFTITADNLYRIASLTTNGSAVSQPFGNDDVACAFTWSNVQANGSITSTYTDQLVTTTPFPVPKTWLHDYYPATNNYDDAAVSDTDTDRMKAWQEYVAGTSPINPDSVFNIVHGELENTLFRFVVATEPAHEYSVYYTDSLTEPVTWHSFPNPLYGTWTETNTVSTNHTFNDDYSTNTTGGHSATGFRAYRMKVFDPNL